MILQQRQEKYEVPHGMYGAPRGCGGVAVCMPHIVKLPNMIANLGAAQIVVSRAVLVLNEIPEINKQ